MISSIRHKIIAILKVIDSKLHKLNLYLTF